MEFNSQKVSYVQTPYGEIDNPLQIMVEKNLIPADALDYKCKFIATYDCETIEDKIEGPEKKFGMTHKAYLKLLSIAAGTSSPGIKSRCWIRKDSSPEEEEKIAKVSKSSFKFFRITNYIFQNLSSQ